jgi:hypothetical protein
VANLAARGVVTHRTLRAHAAEAAAGRARVIDLDAIDLALYHEIRSARSRRLRKW